MVLLKVALNPWPRSSRFAFVREPTGQDEILPSGSSPSGASQLVQDLLVDAPSSAVTTVTSASMSLADRDRLVAALYGECFGDAISVASRCSACSKTFEIDFSLRDFVHHLDERVAAPANLRAGPDAAGVHLLDDGTRFRLPTVEDERAILGLAPAESVTALLGRCVLEGEVARVGESVQVAMESLAPLASSVFPANCAECSAEQTIDFDLVRFFLAAVEREQPLLMREVHCLARAYGWSCGEILGLPRRQRRAYVALIIAEHDGGRAA
jgi:hypothetical protein